MDLGRVLLIYFAVQTLIELCIHMLLLEQFAYCVIVFLPVMSQVP